VPSYELFSNTEVLGRMAMERMLAGLSTRSYPVGLEPVGARTAQTATSTSTSKSAVSRRFVAATETALAQLLAANLSELDLVAFMVDGVHLGEHPCVVALGIGIDGTKHPLALVEGSTENATLVTDLIVGLRERGLDVTRPVLPCSTGPRRCAAPWSMCSTTRCSSAANSHKIRNVRDRLPREAALGGHRPYAAEHLGAPAEPQFAGSSCADCAPTGPHRGPRRGNGGQRGPAGSLAWYATRRWSDLSPPGPASRGRSHPAR